MTTWVLFAGLPAVGKSTLAQALEKRLNGASPEGTAEHFLFWRMAGNCSERGRSIEEQPSIADLATSSKREDALAAVTLDKDRIRDTLFPGALTDYTPEQDDLCMRIILEAAAYLTVRARVAFVLIDGRTFSRRRQIETALNAAEKAGANWRIVHLACPDEVAEARLAAAGSDHRSKHPAQNRDLALYRKIKQEFEPILQPKLDLDSTRAIESNVEAILHYLED